MRKLMISIVAVLISAALGTHKFAYEYRQNDTSQLMVMTSCACAKCGSTSYYVRTLIIIQNSIFSSLTTNSCGGYH